MNGRYKESDFGHVAILEVQDQMGNLCVVEKGKFVIKFLAFQANARVLLKVVVGAQIVLIQNLVHGPASVATKIFVVKHHMFPVAVITTMVASYLFFGSLFCHFLRLRFCFTVSRRSFGGYDI
jgi:nitrous oxide reductase